MIRSLFFFLTIFTTHFSSNAQEFQIEEDPLLSEFLEKISKEELKFNLSILAADSLRGRETGQLGQKKAAQFLVKKLQDYNISGAGDSLEYYQRFSLYSPKYDQIDQIIGTDTLHSWQDFYTFSTANDTIYEGSEISFLGYGIDSENYSDYLPEREYSGLGVVFKGEPKDGEKYLISNSLSPSEWSDNTQLKIDVAQKKGLSGLFIVNEQFDQLLPRVVYYQKNSRPRLTPYENSRFPVIITSPEKFNELFGKWNYSQLKDKLNRLKPVKRLSLEKDWKIRYKTKQEKLFSENILGIIPGKEVPDEYVFITAHYDHLGMQNGEVFNGADDDGSGTSAILEIGRLLKDASLSTNFPKRSIVLLWVSGEEKGLLGSKYYTENPILPLENTVVDLNIDMVGRKDSLHQESDEKYIYLIGSDKLSTDLHELSKQTNAYYTNHVLDYTYNDDQHSSRLYYRSDHYNFAKHNIPVIFYFGGMHEDYHRPTDDLDKIDFNILSEITRLVMATAWHIANAEKRIKVDKPVKLVR